MRTPIASFLMFATLAACGGQSDALLDGSTLLAPISLDGTLVFVDTTRNQALLLDGSGKRPQAAVEHVALPYGAAQIEPRNGSDDEALVLCNGRRSSREDSAEPAALAVIDNAGKLRSYPLGTTPFDTIVQSDDGAYAVLLRKGEEDGRVLSNANQLAVVDLSSTGKSAVTHRTPTSFGHRATGAVFSPKVRIAGEDRRLLVVLSDAEVTLIDLMHPERRETVVQLGGSAGRSVLPAQVLWGSSDEATLYVRGQSSNDVFVFRLEPREASAGQNDFRPSINQLGGGVNPTDMALYDADGDPTTNDPRLLIVSPDTRSAIVVDPNSSKATSVGLQSAARQVLLFSGTSPKNDEVRTRALLYSPGSATVTFLDLDDIATRTTRNTEELSLGNAVTSVLPLLEDNKVILLHQYEGVSILDLAERTAVPILSSVALDEAIFDGERSRLWVAPKGQDRIGTLDLETGVTDEVLLDTAVQHVVPMFDQGKLAVVHDSVVGHVTFVSAAAPSRETARSVRGFLLSDVLDRGAP